MKTSAIKIVQSYLNKKNINNLKKNISKKGLLFAFVTLITGLIFFQLVRPFFFDFNKDEVENKIQNFLKLKNEIKGDISYKLLPTPRIVVENIDLSFDGMGKNTLSLKNTEE